MTLDERSHAEKGSLYLEVKATTHGLVPSLSELLETAIPDFETGNIEDRSLRVVELDVAADDLAPISEHEWRIELKPKGGTLPAAFQFPAVKPELAKEDGLLRQRYVDVDLVPVEASVPLGGSAKRLGPWIGGGIAALAALLAVIVLLFKNRKTHHHDGPALLPLPAHLNAVSVIGFLRRVQQGESITPSMKEAIGKEITALESKHFGREDAPQDPAILEEIAKRWQAA